MTKTNIENLKKCNDGRSLISNCKLSTKFGCSEFHIVYTIQRKTDIDYHKKQKTPDRSGNKLSQLQPRCGRMCRKCRGHVFYFTFSHSNKNANASTAFLKLSNTERNRSLREKKLIWLTILLEKSRYKKIGCFS